MSISTRIFDTIEGWQEEWKDRLRGWALRTISEGFKKFLEDDEPAAITNVDDLITRVNANTATPQYVKDMLVRVKAGSSWWQIIIVIIMAVAMAIQTASTIWQPGIKQMNYAEERAAQTFRFDPISVITAWRRDKAKYAGLFDDLKDLGFSDDRIEALKFVTLFYPAPADLIRWQAREVFEPDMIARYGLDSEFAAIDKEPFYKAGMTDEQILNYWRAHWEHASWQQVVEMLHRGLMTEEQVRDWFRVVEIPPFWRQLLIDSAYTWPTRVDVRRWWDMRTIDEAELRRLYSGMGYRGVNLDNYVLWTKVYVAFPDLMARWTKGWITEADVRSELTGLGMPADRVDEMIQTKIKKTVPEPIDEAKKVSQTAIIKWVKEDTEGRWNQGIDLLMDLGYDEAGARFVLDAYIADMGSPETFEDWKQLTAGYRRAAGMTTPAFNAKLREAAAELVKISDQVNVLGIAVRTEELLLIDADAIPEENEKRLRDLQVALNRARAEKERLQADYNTLVAEFRQTEV